MTADLIKRLRTCSAEERKAVAMELAQRGSEEDIAELTRMVEGGYRRGLRWYNYSDQLVGVEALGETGTAEALELLSRVYSSIRNHGHGARFETYPAYHIDNPSYESVLIDVFVFPWARKELRKRLLYSVELNEQRVENYTLPSRPEEEIEAELREIFGKEPHSIIQGVIRGLEATTGKTAQMVTIDSGWGNSCDEGQLLVEYLQGKHESSRQSAEKHSPQRFMYRQA